MNTTFSVVYQFSVLLFTFGCLLFLVYLTTKFVGKKASMSMKSKHMRVVESISLGMDKTIFLVRVDDQAILLSSSGKTIQYLTEVILKDLDQEETGEIEPHNGMFGKILTGIMNKKSENNKSDSLEKQENVSYHTERIRKAFNLLKANQKSGDENIGQ